MTRTFALLLFALLLAAPSRAQIGIVAYGGYDVDAGTTLFGAGGEFGLPVSAPVALSLRATAEFVSPVDRVIEGRTFNREVLQAHLDLLAEFGSGSVAPYAGLGAALADEKLDTADDDDVEGDQDRASTRIGANLIGGVRTALGPVMPFVEARVTVSAEPTVTALGGLAVRF